MYKGRAELGTFEEQKLIAQVQGAIVARVAPTPAVLAVTLANASRMGSRD